MKNRIFLAIISVLFVAVNLQAQNNYVWLHGLNDNTDCWSIYENDLTPWVGNRLGYPSNASISQVSSDIWTRSAASFNNNTIVIGHSMGGLVARELEFNHPGAIKGIVTIGTPHQGAPVVRNIFAGQAGLLAERVINRIKLSVSSSTVAIQFSIFPGTKSRIITNMTKNYAIGSAVMDLGMFILKVPYQYMDEMRSQVGAQCARDMIPNSPYMATIAKRNVNVPILTFACEEDSWQLARLGFCSKNKSTLQTSRTANAQGSYDNGGVAEMKKWRNGFQTVGGVHTAAAVVFGVVGWWNPRYWVASAANGVAAVNWFSNARYINSGLDYDNAIFVGASHVRAVKHRILWVTWYTHETVADPHDGVVPVSSQQLDKTKGTEVIWATKTITGVNHMEEFNHPNTRKEFTLLFAGNSYKQRFFAR